MSTSLDPVATGTRTPTPSGGRSLLPAVVLALAGVVLAVLSAVDHGGVAWWVATMVTAAWGVGAVLVARRLRDKLLGPLMGLFALVIGAALWTAAEVSTGNEGMELPRSILTALLLAVAVHLAFAVPDGSLPTGAARTTVIVGYLAAIGLGLAVGSEQDLPDGALRGGGAGCRRGRADRLPGPVPQGVAGGPGPPPVDRLGRGAGVRHRRPRRPARRSPRLARSPGHRHPGRHGGDPGRLRGDDGAPPADGDRPGAGPHGRARRAPRPRRGRLPLRGRRPRTGAGGRGALGPRPVDGRRRHLRRARLPRPAPPRGGGQPAHLRRAHPARTTP